MASNLLELTFSSNGRIIQMNKKAEFRVITIEGIEASEYSINAVDSNQDRHNCDIPKNRTTRNYNYGRYKEK